jgi:excisionase family DNA binding protein
LSFKSMKKNLKESAEYFGLTEKTFRKYVIEYHIPHIRFGRVRLFDLPKVEAFLESISFDFTEKQEFAPLKVKSNVRAIGSNSRYAKLLGLD